MTKMTKMTPLTLAHSYAFSICSKPLNPLVPPRGRVVPREGLQCNTHKIHLPEKEKEKEKQRKDFQNKIESNRIFLNSRIFKISDFSKSISRLYFQKILKILQKLCAPNASVYIKSIF